MAPPKMLSHMESRQWLMENRSVLFEDLDDILLKQHGSFANTYTLDNGIQNLTAWISAEDGLWRHILQRKNIIEPTQICRIHIRWAGLCMTTIDIADTWDITVERQFKWEGHSWYHTEEKLLRRTMEWISSCLSYRKVMAQKQSTIIKEELISAVLAPHRIEQWLDQGVELEAM